MKQIRLKRRTMLVPMCGKCPMSTTYEDKSGYYCRGFGARILDMGRISDWCPLEDAEIKLVIGFWSGKRNLDRKSLKINHTSRKGGLKKVNANDGYIIQTVIKRFSAIVNSLECECSEEYTCSIHNDRVLAEQAIAAFETVFMEDAE